MSLTCSHHKAAAVNRRVDSFQSLTLNCLAMDRGDRKVNSLIAALSSGDKPCTRDVGIYCSSQPTISTCLFWIGNRSSCQRRAEETRELVPANVAYVAIGERPCREYGPEPNPPPAALRNASCFISPINDIISHQEQCKHHVTLHSDTLLFSFPHLPLSLFLLLSRFYRTYRTYHNLSTSHFGVSACFQV